MVERFDDFMVHSRKLYHKPTTQSIILGNGYSAVFKGSAPEMKEWSLKFKGYKWYLNSDGTLDLQTNKKVNNFGWLLDFFMRHELYTPFIYPDPIYGDKLVRFSSILDENEVYSGSDGVLEPFELRLVEVSE